jgi:hypothetical protein
MSLTPSQTSLTLRVSFVSRQACRCRRHARLPGQRTLPHAKSVSPKLADDHASEGGAHFLHARTPFSSGSRSSRSVYRRRRGATIEPFEREGAVADHDGGFLNRRPLPSRRQPPVRNSTPSRADRFDQGAARDSHRFSEVQEPTSERVGCCSAATSCRASPRAV